MKFTAIDTATDAVSVYGEKKCCEDFIIAEGDFYIPVNMAAKLLGYKYGF